MLTVWDNNEEKKKKIEEKRSGKTEKKGKENGQVRSVTEHLHKK